MSSAVSRNGEIYETWDWQEDSLVISTPPLTPDPETYWVELAPDTPVVENEVEPELEPQPEVGTDSPAPEVPDSTADEGCECATSPVTRRPELLVVVLLGWFVRRRGGRRPDAMPNN